MSTAAATTSSLRRRLPSTLPPPSLDRGGGLVEGASHRFQDRELGKTARVAAGGQRQFRVRRVHVDNAPAPIGDPAHPHRSEHAGQPAAMALLPPGPRLPFRPSHYRPPSLCAHRVLFALRPHVEVILHQLPQQLTSLLFEQQLQLVVGHTPRRGVGQRRDQALEGIAGGEVRITPA